MKTTPMSEADAKRVSNAEPLPPGWRDARIIEASDRYDKNAKGMIELVLLTADSQGNERQIRDWLTSHQLGALKLRHATVAVEALDKYEAGEIRAKDFVGKDVRIRLETKKKRGLRPWNEVIDYEPINGGEVRLRA